MPSFVTWPMMMTAVEVRLGEAHELRRALAQLGDPAGGTRHRRRLHRLNGVDHQQGDFALGGQRNDGLQVSFGHTTQSAGRQPQALRPQPDLGNRLLAAGVEHACDAGNMRGHLQQQSGLADTRVATEQGHGARDNAGAEHPVQLLLPGAEPAGPCGQVESSGRGAAAGAGAARGSRGDPGLECVPFVTMRTLPLPLGGIPAAVATNKYWTRASHLCVVGVKLARIRARGLPNDRFVTRHSDCTADNASLCRLESGTGK